MITDDTDHNHHIFVELARSNDIDKGSFSRMLKILYNSLSLLLLFSSLS